LDLLKPNEVAQRLAVSRAWVYEAAKSGRIPSVRIGGDDGPLRFVPEDIDQWLSEARAEWSPGMSASGHRRDSERSERSPRNGQPRRPARASKLADQQALL